MLNAQSSHDESINVNEDHEDPYNTFRRTNLSPSIPYECIIEFDYIGLDLGLGFHPGVKSFSLEFVPVWFSVRLAEAVRTSLAFKVAVDGYTALSRPDRIPGKSSNERWARLSIGTRHSSPACIVRTLLLIIIGNRVHTRRRHKLLIYAT